MSITQQTLVANNYQWHESNTQQSLASDLADRITVELSAAIAQRGQAIIAFSGGSTPKPLFEALLTRNIDWSKVIVTLVDERWAPIGHPLSNAGFLIDHLLGKLPTTPKFVPLFNISAAAMNASMSLIPVLCDYARITESTIAQPARFDVSILGMGSDAHTASFFPDADNIKQLVDPNSTEMLLSCTSPSSQIDRVTWSLPMLLKSSFLALHFTGKSKRNVFEQALGDSNAELMPIRSFLFQTEKHLNVYYSD